MPRPLRNTEPKKLHLLSCRTRSSELLLVPSPELNSIVGGVIAKYSQLYSINLYAVCVLSNHYHLLLSTNVEGGIALFAENINREIGKRVNRLLNREGSLWSRRYDDLLVLEEQDALEALIYTITNPTKHGLVANPNSWPGITSYGQDSKTYTFFNYTEYSAARSKSLLTGEVIRRSDYEKEYELKIDKLPMFSNLSNVETKKLILKEAEKRVRKLNEEKWAKQDRFLGRKAILNQRSKGAFPKKTNKTKRPVCYTRCKRALTEFIEETRLIREKYSLASIKYRLVIKDFDFPPYCYFPPMHHTPKFVPS